MMAVTPYVEVWLILVVDGVDLGFFFFYVKLRVISWNVRGLNNPKKREFVKYWLRNWKCDMVCLQETNLAEVDLQLVRSL